MDLESKLSQDIAKAHSMDLWGSAPQVKPQLSKKDFLEKINQSDYHEITEAELHGRSLQFTLQVNGENYNGHSLISQDYIDTKRLFRKAKIEDFKELSIHKKKNTLPFHFKLNPVESPKVNKILEEVLRIINSDGDVEEGSVNKPPKSPKSDFDHESPETRRKKSRDLHLNFSTSA